MRAIKQKDREAIGIRCKGNITEKISYSDLVVDGLAEMKGNCGIGSLSDIQLRSRLFVRLATCSNKKICHLNLGQE